MCGPNRKQLHAMGRKGYQEYMAGYMDVAELDQEYNVLVGEFGPDPTAPESDQGGEAKPSAGDMTLVGDVLEKVISVAHEALDELRVVAALGLGAPLHALHATLHVLGLLVLPSRQGGAINLPGEQESPEKAEKTNAGLFADLDTAVIPMPNPPEGELPSMKATLIGKAMEALEPGSTAKAAGILAKLLAEPHKGN